MKSCNKNHDEMQVRKSQRGEGSMGDFDVLIIGGHSLTEVGGTEARSRIRLRHNSHYATLDFIKQLVESKGNLQIAERMYAEKNKSRFVSRSLNSIYLLDYLTKNSITAEVVNYFALEQGKFNELVRHQPKIVAISTTFISDAKDINTIAKAVKELSPNSMIIAGGTKILKSFKKYTLFKQNYFDGFDIEALKSYNFFFDYEIDKYIDAFVIEECGEVTLLDLIRKIKNGYDWKTTPNIAYYEKSNLVFTKRVKEPYTFEQNLISWDKIPEDILGNEIPVRAGMGCPFKCAFCDFTGLHSRVRLRPIESLIRELRFIQEAFPGKSIFFTDDNLFITKRRTKELAQAIVKNGLRFNWRGFFRVDAVSEDNVEILAKSGCKSCLLGVESGDEIILRNMNKRSAREQTLKTVNLLNQNGINTLSTIIIGFPGETKESVDETINLLNSYPSHNGTINHYWPFTFILLPLAPVASSENRKKYRVIGGYEKWTHRTMNSDEAKEHLFRCFQQVDGPTLPYPEYAGPGISVPISKIKEIFKARENIVKGGINVIDESNVLTVYQTFKKILSN